MSIFKKAWSVVRDVREAVKVVADLGEALVAIFNIASKPVRDVIGLARKVDKAADAVEDSAGGYAKNVGHEKKP